MTDPNWWLMVLAFVLGLALTFALMIRRVNPEVPVGSDAAEDDATKDGSAG